MELSFCFMLGSLILSVVAILISGSLYSIFDKNRRVVKNNFGVLNKRVTGLAILIDQMECSHERINFTEGLNRYWAKCALCGKYLKDYEKKEDWLKAKSDYKQGLKLLWDQIT